MTENRLVGIVTVDDAIGRPRRRGHARTSPRWPLSRRVISPIRARSLFTIFKNRIPWLLLLMVSATFTGIIITKFFEDALSVCVALTSFIPMLMDTSGKRGQPVVRNDHPRHFAGRDRVFRSRPSVVWREARVSILCGVALAACAFLKAHVL